MRALRRDERSHWDARIAGPLAALIGLVHGAYDGDALFFSRDLVIEGDTAAVLALRNAIDNEELDLAARDDAPVRSAGEARRRRARAKLAAAIGALTGVALTACDRPARMTASQARTRLPRRNPGGPALGGRSRRRIRSIAASTTRPTRATFPA